MHSKIFGTSFDWLERLETDAVPPIVDIIAAGAPNEFYTSGRSTWSLTWANGLSIYDAVADGSRSLAGLCLGNGGNANSLIDSGDSLYSRIRACENRLSVRGL
ncbi:hypothetical protein ELI25_04090 [Rhizobium ruizarguesonis]|uniref:hypothetical protein n=1 Tax=Rhizobium ruizarguesonis TaxID=2081791 RepID=UPI0010325B3D|nr:hypothetical protein [Rhizobium ruizarguesonis]TAW15086.1 hypothetical protein ELI25_04090 [Rhizobium ruizarguesonis]